MAIISMADKRMGIKRQGQNAGDGHDARSRVGTPGHASPKGFPAIGIDLGTTHSVVSVYHEHDPAPVVLHYEGQPLVPSVLFWSGTELMVGRAAIDAAGPSGRGLVRSTKPAMGKKTSMPPGSSNSVASFSSGGRCFSPEEAAAAVLQHLASHETLRTLRQDHGGLWAVITVPAHFDDAARRATLEAAHQAGIQVLRVVNEPTSAALAYSFLRGESHDLQCFFQEGQEDLVVYDLGGGTFDVSVVRREGLIFKVLASEGDMALGGDDLDTLLAESLRSAIQPEFVARRLDRSSELYPALLDHARAIKHRMGEEGLLEIDVPLGDSGSRLQTTLDRQSFDALATPLLERTLYLTEQALQKARIGAEQLSRVLLVGGSTRLPLVQKLLETYFPEVVVDARLQPDLAVSWGAALQASIIQGTAPETVLVDVCTHSLGIGVVHDREAIDEHYKWVKRQFGIDENLPEQELRRALGDRLEAFHAALQNRLRVAPIIRRNSSLPARKSEFFSTLYDDQSAVQVIVAQGEGETVGENRLIGSFLFDLQRPCPKGTKCEIQLTYDVNGMVQVFARQIGTDNVARAIFDSRSGQVEGWQAVPQADLSSMAPVNVGNQSGADNNVALLNALLVRARRLLRAKKTEASGSSVALLDDLRSKTIHYERLLADALEGLPVDHELDLTETCIAELCAALEH